MARDRQTSAGLGPRLRPERAISTINRIRTIAPSTTHSQMRSEPELLLAAGEVAAAAAVSLGLRLGRLMGVLIEAPLRVPLHPVTSKPAATAAPVRTTDLVQRRGPRSPGDRSAEKAVASTAQASPWRYRRTSPVAGDLCRAQGGPSSGSRSASPVNDAVTTSSG